MKRIIICTVFFIFFTSEQTMAQTQNSSEFSNEFAFEFFQQISDAEKNMFFSPYSISLALAMTYEGAENETAEVMRKVLHFPESKQEMREAFAEDKNIMTNSPDPKKYVFKIANAVWASDNVLFRPEYFKRIKDYYHAPVKSVNFKRNKTREAARLDINKWTEKNTEGKIKDLLQKNDLDAATLMVLVNAVYFKAEWESQFQERLTEKDVFHNYKNEKISIDFMNQSLHLNYYRDELIAAVEIPYSYRKASMHILLPHNMDDFKTLQKEISNSYFQKITGNATPKNIKLQIPKFKTEDRLYLEKEFVKAGMAKAFSGDADFTGMSKNGNISIDKIIHQTFIDVNEDGTEAAAATAVVMKRTSVIVQDDLIDYKADKPFIYFITDNQTGAVIFAGQIVNPK